MSPAPLLPNTDFSTVEYFTSEMAYVVANPVFDGLTQYLGHHPKLTDDSLDPTGILSRVAAVVEPFKVTRVGTTGSVITWVAGQVNDLEGVTKSVASGQLNLTADTTNYIYIGQNTSTGVVSVLTSADASDVVAFQKLPVMKRLLAKVVVTGANISLIEDLRMVAVRHLTPPSSSIRVFGGQSSTDWVATQGQTISGIIVCRNATIPAGITVTVDKYVKFVCSGNWTNNGQINQNRPDNGYAGGFPSLVKGAALDPYETFGYGNGSRGVKYEPTITYQSSGGGSGEVVTISDDPATVIRINRGSGGNGGATILIEAFGFITQNGTVDLSGDNATPTVFAPFNGASAGCGGGSGGLFMASSRMGITFTPTGLTNVKGGNGSNGVVTAGSSILPQGAVGGGAASGGWVDLYSSGVINTTGHTFLLSGGSVGLPATANGALTLISSGVWRANNGTAIVNGAAYGGAFANDQAGTTVVTGATTTTFTPNPAGGGIGVVRLNPFNPIF